MQNCTIKSWKSFDFGPVKSTPKKSTINTTRNKGRKNQPIEKTTNIKSSTFDFHSNLKPKNVSELAVHKKKIEEVQFWLERVFSDTRIERKTPFLLISGPTGSGKTTTLNVLCKTMNISISEWINPTDEDFELRGPNQVDKFLEYIGTDSNYVKLFVSDNSRKIVLVEDFPNVFMKNFEQFHDVLEQCYHKAKNPVVFICAEVTNQKVNLLYHLFPQEILDKYQITQISFNACATTQLKSCLKRAQELVTKNKDIFQVPSSLVIDAILSSSAGDIKCAVNQFYFASVLGSSEMPVEFTGTIKTGNKRKKTDKSSVIKIMAKDESLGLFHALGRVLNPKKIEHEKSWRINCNLNNLISELESQPENVISFLFTNYIKYMGHLKDIEKASELLCIAQKYFNNFTERKDLQQYPLWISILGLMVVNNHKVSKWNQIEGPKKIKKKILRNQETKSPIDEFYIGILRKS